MRAGIEIDAARIESEIEPMIYGHFIENMARCIYGGLLRNERPGFIRGPWKLREDLLAMVKEIKPPVIRWPGGLFADGYHWRDGVGPPGARPLKRNRYWSRYGPFTRVLDPNVFGSDEFIELVNALGAVPYVNVNLGTGSAREAARWVEYMNGAADTLEGRRRAEYGRSEPVGVRLWGIGNEMYGIWSLGHCGPLEYARRYAEFREAMEAVDPDLRYVAVGADKYFNKTWNREVLSEIGDRVDYLSIHIYLPGPERMAGVLAARLRNGSAGLYHGIVAAPLEVERRLNLVKKDIDAAMGPDSSVEVTLDEWNLWWKLSQLLVPRFTLRDALFVCGTFHALHRTSHFLKMANIAQMVNVLGLLCARGERVYRSTIYYPFLMYTGLAGPKRLGTKVKCETFSTTRVGGIPSMRDVPVLDCTATMSEDGMTLTLFVINRHMTDDVPVELHFDGFSPGGQVDVHCLNGPGANSVNSYGRDEVVGIKREMFDAGDILPLYTFPAHSVTALVLKAQVFRAG